MSETLQWVIAGAAVLVATMVLVRKLRAHASGQHDSPCDSCPMNKGTHENS